MATISVKAALSSDQTGAVFASADRTGTVTQTGLDCDAGSTQNIGTTDGAVTLPAGVGTIGYICLQHMGIDSAGSATAKYVDLSYDTGGSFAAYAFARIPSGCPMLWKPTFPTGKTAIYAKAETGATNGVQLRKWIAEA